MPKLQYVGTSDVRSISKAQWAQVGIEHDAIEIDRRESFAEELTVVNVSEEAADLLLEREGGDWKRVDDSTPARAAKGGDPRSAEEESAEPRRSRRRAVEPVAGQAEAAQE
jgi:hypothetical protein